MIHRVENFYSYLNVNEKDQIVAKKIAEQYGDKSNGMTHVNDYHALASIAIHYRPSRILEIGTFMGLTSDFFLSILPKTEVISIAYINEENKIFNNSELTKDQIGIEVKQQNKSRFTQLYGDSHKLDSNDIVKTYGFFDLVFIDGDHSAKGVELDTMFAQKIISEHGAICWHDANPKRRYLSVREYLENNLSLTAIATKDNYTGGIALWSRDLIVS